MTLLERIDRCPPSFCRLVARKNRGRAAMTRRDIARASGLSLRAVDYLSKRASWVGIPIETVNAFSRGCGVDLLHPQKHIDWFLRRKHSAWRGLDKTVDKLLISLRTRTAVQRGAL